MTDLTEILAAFEKFDIQSHDPKWSSWVLERFFETALTQPEACVTDVFRGFNLALKVHHVKLTPTVANLAMDLVKTGFSLHRGAFAKAEWNWALEELTTGASPAQCYLYTFALPPATLTPAVIVAILRGLEGTTQFDEAVLNLSDDFEQPAVKADLHEWQAEGMRPETVTKLQQYL